MPKNEPLRLGDTLLQLGDKVRVEEGPKRKTAKATAALLDDAVTASHYHLPREVDGKTVVARDALGKPIAEGQPMTYLDHLGDRCWYIYQLQTEGVVDAVGAPVLGDDGQPQTVERWVAVGEVDGDEAAAVEAARAFL